MITWRMNYMGNIEIWNGTGINHQSTPDLYFQSEDDVIAFLQHIGKTLDDVSLGEWGECEDVGYFEEKTLEAKKLFWDDFLSVTKDIIKMGENGWTVEFYNNKVKFTQGLARGSQVIIENPKKLIQFVEDERESGFINGYSYYRNSIHGNMVAYYPDNESMHFNSDEQFKNWLDAERLQS